MSDLRIVTNQIITNMMELSGNKFSSQIIESIIGMQHLELNQTIALSLVGVKEVRNDVKRGKRKNSSENEVVLKLMQDQYGNYVLKNLYTALDRDTQNIMYNKL